MTFFAIFIVVEGGVELLIRQDGVQLAGSLMYLRNEEIWTRNHVAINIRDGILLKN